MQPEITWVSQYSPKALKMAGLCCETSRQELAAKLAEMDGDTVEIVVRRLPISPTEAVQEFKPIGA